MFTLGVPTYRRYDLLGQMIGSMLQGTVQPADIVIIDNGGGFGRPDWLPPNARVITPGCNIGVAAGWNAIMDHSTSERVLIVNDDVSFGPSSIARLMTALDDGASIAVSESASAFSCFMLTRALFGKVGRFDEQFRPAYFEDNDYYRRMRLLGEDFVSAPADGFVHACSSTLASYNAQERQVHNSQFESNRARFVAKWGGLPGHETFVTPYGR